MELKTYMVVSPFYGAWCVFDENEVLVEYNNNGKNRLFVERFNELHRGEGMEEVRVALLRLKEKLTKVEITIIDKNAN